MAEGVFSIHLQNQLHGIREVSEAFVLSFALAVGSGDFEAGGPKAAFVRLATVEDRGVVFHSGEVTQPRLRFQHDPFYLPLATK